MNGHEHDEVHRDLGAYVLRALRPTDRDRVERHVATCPRCRDEVAELAAIPPLLDRLDETDLDPTLVHPGPEVVIARIARERRRQRWRSRSSAAAAVAAVLVLAAVLSVPRTWPGDAQPPTLLLTSPDRAVTAELEDRAWGMAVRVEATALPQDVGYMLWAVANDGHRAHVASWSSTDGPVRLDGSCYLDADEVQRLEVVGATDETVTVALTPRSEPLIH